MDLLTGSYGSPYIIPIYIYMYILYICIYIESPYIHSHSLEAVGSLGFEDLGSVGVRILVLRACELRSQSCPCLLAPLPAAVSFAAKCFVYVAYMYVGVSIMRGSNLIIVTPSQDPLSL